jgi:hypothetical protein
MLGERLLPARALLTTVCLLTVAPIVGGCVICPDNDGLPPKEWEARERRRAAALLPRARREIVRQSDSLWAATRPRNTEAELASPIDEYFMLGGVVDLGGPRYAHSCIGFLDAASLFSLKLQRAWIGPDSLVIAVAWLWTDRVEKTGRGAPTVKFERKAIGLTHVKDAQFFAIGDSGTVDITVTEDGQDQHHVFAIRRSDAAAAKMFVDRALRPD